MSDPLNVLRRCGSPEADGLDDAKADLRQIKAFISERNIIAAEGVIDRIRKTLTLLAILPRLGHPGLVHGTFEKGVPFVVS